MTRGARRNVANMALDPANTMREGRAICRPPSRPPADAAPSALDPLTLRAVLDAAPDALVVVDVQGRIVLFNAQASALLGYAADEVIGRSLECLVPARFREVHADKRRAHVAAPVLRSRRVHALRRDGSELDVECTVGAPCGDLVVASLREAGARERAEQAHRRSEESLARAQRVAHLGSWEWDLGTDQTYRSAELSRLLGAGPDEGTGRYRMLWDRIHPDDLALVESTIKEAAEVGLCFSLEHRVVRPDGTERLVLHQGEPIFEGTRLVRLTGTLLDVTDRARAERELQATMLRLETIVDECPVGISILDPQGHLRSNARGREILGQVGEQPLASFEGRTRSADGSLLALDQTPGPRALRGERVPPVELGVRRPDGSVVPVKMSATPLRDAQGRVSGAVVVYDDITAEKELERLHAEWGSVVAHDLRQPLNAIALHCQLLARAQGAPDSVKTSAREIHGATRRLDHMIHDLMDISRLEAHRVTLVRRPVDVVAHARATSEPIGLSDPSRPIEVRVHGEVPPVDADADRLAQVLENLMTNAIKYGAPETRVLVDIRRRSDDDVVEVAVTNRGPGIAPEDMPRIFERFHRAQGVQRGPLKGVGLGLYIVRELVEAHGGRVTATSQPGEETTFAFTLPIAAAGRG